MTRLYQTSGTSRPWEVAPDRNRASLNGARLERTPNPTRFDRICIAIILAVTAGTIAVAVTPTVSSAPRAEVVPPASVVGTGAGGELR